MKIAKLLLAKGFSPHLKGFKFLVSAIQLILDDESLIGNITYGLYPKIAQLYKGETPSKVDRAMRTATAQAGIKQSNSEFICRTVLDIKIAIAEEK